MIKNVTLAPAAGLSVTLSGGKRLNAELGTAVVVRDGGSADLSAYYTAAQTDAAIAAAVEEIELTPGPAGPAGPQGPEGPQGPAGAGADLTGYATEEYVNQKISEAQMGGTDGTTVDLSGYYTKTETDAAIQTAVTAAIGAAIGGSY